MGTRELERLFGQYFRMFPWKSLPVAAEGFDLGCGSGRWARLVAPRVGKLHCIDASPDALAVARAALADFPGCRFHLASVNSLPLAAGAMDFGYSLGVLHHLPDTRAALAACAAKLKPGAPFLAYIYYALENRPAWYRALWRLSDLVRQVLSRAPFPVRRSLADAAALGIYWPMATAWGLLERTGLDVSGLPLAAYRYRSFYSMRTDALDRLGTRLERRFTAAQIRGMMEDAGLERVAFSDAPPFWCAVGYRRASP